MAKLFRHVMIAVAAWVLITTTLLLTSHQAYTREINTSTTQNVSLLQQISQPPQEVDSLAQIISIEEIPDVSPDDDYYEALRDIVEKYKIYIPFSESREFRGNQPLTRGQFVERLHNGLDRLLEVLAAGVGDPSLMVDNLEQITAALVESNLSFEEELAQIKVRLEELEGRVK